MKYLRNLKFPQSYPIALIILMGAFLRFRGLNWGLPYPFHPDERNMAVAITGFSSQNLDPRFYAYGQFPLYLAYFSARLLSFWFPAKFGEFLKLDQAILFLRFWSAIFSTATICLAYLISQKIFASKKLLTFNFSLLTATAVAFTPGLIQAAHFGTTESILTFCFLAIIYFSLKILEKSNLKNYLSSGFFLGIALGTKITAVVFAVPLFLAALWQLKNILGRTKRKPASIFKVALSLIYPERSSRGTLSLAFALALALLVSPYLLLAYKETKGTLLYEISVAGGKSPVFYTRQFIKTFPVLFQLEKIFPYALGWPIFIFGTLGFILLTVSLIKSAIKRKFSLAEYSLFLFLFSFLIYFLPNAFLFAKWTRFMTPIFPFSSIFSVYFLDKIIPLIKYKKSLSINRLPSAVYCLLFIVFSLPGLFFSQIYFKPDIRFAASEWIYQNIPSGSQVLFDTANVVDIPILPPNRQSPAANYFLKMISFNFYDLDQMPELKEDLLNYLEKTDYIFVPSRRVFANHLRFPEKYPLVTKYYQLLFSGKLGYKEIKTFFPFSQPLTANYQLQISDEKAEETFTVFDHPVIRIYKKETDYNKQAYENLFKN